MLACLSFVVFLVFVVCVWLILFSLWVTACRRAVPVQHCACVYHGHYHCCHCNWQCPCQDADNDNDNIAGCRSVLLARTRLPHHILTLRIMHPPCPEKNSWPFVLLAQAQGSSLPSSGPYRVWLLSFDVRWQLIVYCTLLCDDCHGQQPQTATTQTTTTMITTMTTPTRTGRNTTATATETQTRPSKVTFFKICVIEITSFNRSPPRPSIYFTISNCHGNSNVSLMTTMTMSRPTSWYSVIASLLTLLGWDIQSIKQHLYLFL